MIIYTLLSILASQVVFLTLNSGGLAASLCTWRRNLSNSLKRRSTIHVSPSHSTCYKGMSLARGCELIPLSCLLSNKGRERHVSSLLPWHCGWRLHLLPCSLCFKKPSKRIHRPNYYKRPPAKIGKIASQLLAKIASQLLSSLLGHYLVAGTLFLLGRFERGETRVEIGKSAGDTTCVGSKAGKGVRHKLQTTSSFSLRIRWCGVNIGTDDKGVVWSIFACIYTIYTICCLGHSRMCMYVYLCVLYVCMYVYLYLCVCCMRVSMEYSLR